MIPGKLDARQQDPWLESDNFPAPAKTTSYTCERWTGNAISIRMRRIVERALRYYCNTCKRIVRHPCRKQNETDTSIGLTVLDQNGTVAHRRVRRCENCEAEEFTTLELKERDFHDLLRRINSSEAKAAAARQELVSLKRAVLDAVELSTKHVRNPCVPG